MSRSNDIAASAPFDLAAHLWTSEDIRFVLAQTDAFTDDPHAPLDSDVSVRVSRVLDIARESVNQLQAELGHPEGFDPLVQSLLYARARQDAARENEAVKRQLDAVERELETCRQALEAASELIDMYREATG